MTDDVIKLDFSTCRGEHNFEGISFIKYDTVKRIIQKDPRLLVKCICSVDELHVDEEDTRDLNKLTDEELIEIYNDNAISFGEYDNTLKYYTVSTSEESGCYIILPGTDLYKIVAIAYVSEQTMLHLEEMLEDRTYG